MSLFASEAPALSSFTTVSGYKVIPYEVLNVPLAATSTSQAIFIIGNFPTSGTANTNPSYKVIGVAAVFGTASTSGTLTIEHLTGTQASGAGTAMLTGTISLAGTANTVLYGTLNTSLTAAQQTLSPGDRLGVVLGGTLTNLANCYLQILIAPA